MNANQENERIADNPAVKLLNAMYERYRWQPIAELHEDFGPCVGVNINDPGHIVIVHACDNVRDGSVTHFTRFAPLTNEHADKLREDMRKEAEYITSGVDPDYERLMTS